MLLPLLMNNLLAEAGEEAAADVDSRLARPALWHTLEREREDDEDGLLMLLLLGFSPD